MAQTTAAGRAPRIRPATVLTLHLSAVAVAAVAAFLILDDRSTVAGVAALISGTALVTAGIALTDLDAPRLTFVDAAAERAVDAALFAALAWALLPEEPRAGVAAIVAVSASYVASYVRARATSLGFVLGRAGAARVLRLLAVIVGLLAGEVEGGLWAAAAVALWVAVARSLAVRRMEEPTR